MEEEKELEKREANERFKLLGVGEIDITAEDLDVDSLKAVDKECECVNLQHFKEEWSD